MSTRAEKALETTSRVGRLSEVALRAGVSALALCASLAVAAPALAQTVAPKPTKPKATASSAGQVQQSGAADAPESSVANSTAIVPPADEKGTIVVTGIRQSLANSQNIKRRSDTVVDAITAEDIGALPDRSVTEALQRVPGVAINRFAGSNDPDHFSVEGSGVVIRGLNFVRSEFNGRDTFSANAGRQLGFNDVASELLGSVEVYKNVTAEMIEGGLAGTVNLNTRLPFDKKGPPCGIFAGSELQRLYQKDDTYRIVSSQRHLGHTDRTVRAAWQLRLFAGKKPCRRHASYQFSNP